MTSLTTLPWNLVTKNLQVVEGLEAEEIAMVTGRPLKTVRESIASIQQRLREEMLEKALV
jgi:DNA-directed RNA polymerase specialized sigma24 family protein